MNFFIVLLICAVISFLVVMLLLWYAETHDEGLESQQKACDETIKRIRNEKNKN
jgi:hypothetical protein